MTMGVSQIMFHAEINKRSEGPFRVDQLREMRKAGKITDSTLVVKLDGNEGWQPLSSYADLIMPSGSIRGAVTKAAKTQSRPQTVGMETLNREKLPFVFILTGFVIMCWFSIFYSTAQVETHDIGIMSNRISAMLFGGFLFVGGCVLRTGSRRRP